MDPLTIDAWMTLAVSAALVLAGVLAIAALPWSRTELDLLAPPAAPPPPLPPPPPQPARVYRRCGGPGMGLRARALRRRAEWSRARDREVRDA